MPATFEVLANYIAEEVEKNKIETVKAYITALRSHHINNGKPTAAFDDPRLARIFKGALRIQGIKPIRERAEITKDVLTAIVATLRNDYNGLNLKAAFCTAFAAFLRPAEFTWEKWDPTSSPLTFVSRQSIQFTTQGILLHLPKSKTDQYRQGSIIPLSPSGDSTCPVNALQTLFQKHPEPSTAPLFSRALGPFNKRWLTDNINISLLHAGYDPTTYSGHSFRRGAANSAVEAGISRDDIKKMGRWKSDAVDRYLTQSSTNAQLFDVNRRLHLAPS